MGDLKKETLLLLGLRVDGMICIISESLLGFQKCLYLFVGGIQYHPQVMEEIFLVSIIFQRWNDALTHITVECPRNAFLGYPKMTNQSLGHI